MGFESNVDSGLLGRINAVKRQSVEGIQSSFSTPESHAEPVDSNNELRQLDIEDKRSSTQGANQIREYLGISTQEQVGIPTLQEISNTLLRIYGEDKTFKFDSSEKAKAEFELAQLNINRAKLDALRNSNKTIRELAILILKGEVSAAPTNTEVRGKDDGESTATRLELEKAFSKQQTITIIRSNDKVDSGWSIIGFTEDGKINVIKEGVGQKFISEDMFVEIDEIKLTVGSPVRVLRTGGEKPEEGWQIKGFERNHDHMDVTVVSNDGTYSKVVPYDILMKWNKKG